MKDDLVERLRKVEGGPFPAGSIGTCWQRNPDGLEAAARITMLETALQDISNRVLCPVGPMPSVERLAAIAEAALTSTREGLTGGEEG